MISALFIGIAAPFVLGTGILIHGIATAVEAYQDESGFHEGRDSMSRRSFPSIAKAVVVRTSGPQRQRVRKKRAVEIVA
jgi:hypothetical protein